MNVGIESISFYSSHYYIDLKTLAERRNLPPEKFYLGIGQEKMAVPPPDEDVVTMAANAGFNVLKNIDKEKIDTVLFATESGIDQSKAAGIYVHSLLDLPQNCRVVELKQACYSGTGGLQMAFAYVHTYPQRKVLVFTADVARYGLCSAGEPTQGAGAAAMVISAEPKILALDAESGCYTQDVMDFWRPNYRDEALVDGKYSVRVYLKALAESWADYQQKSGRAFAEFGKFAYHLPFTRMGEKAHLHLAKTAGVQNLTEDQLLEQIRETLIYNRITGNSYAASLYIGLISLLENCPRDLGEKNLGLFSYGSGCVGEFFSGVIQKGYQEFLLKEEHKNMLESRTKLTCDEYEYFYTFPLPSDGSTFELPRNETGRFRLAALKDHKRIYERIP
jgi:hydroxymethylglutaryl-CoA synthase